jgi:hypothetical protein
VKFDSKMFVSTYGTLVHVSQLENTDPFRVLGSVKTEAEVA